MYVSVYVLFCHVIYGWFLCMLYAYICMYLCISIFVCVYICVCASVHIYACVYVCVGTLFYLYKSYLFRCLSGRYLDIYLVDSILAFSFEFQNLNITICTKTSNKST